MKKVLGVIGGVAFTLALIVTLNGDPDPPPPYLLSSNDTGIDIINTYSDPDPPVVKF